MQYLLANHATRLIFEHSANHSDRPMFLYLPFQDTHSPLQAPDEFVRLYPNVKNDNRRVFSGMVSALDSAVGRVMKALKTAEMYNNTIVVFTADVTLSYTTHLATTKFLKHFSERRPSAGSRK